MNRLSVSNCRILSSTFTKRDLHFISHTALIGVADSPITLTLVSLPFVSMYSTIGEKYSDFSFVVMLSDGFKFAGISKIKNAAMAIKTTAIQDIMIIFFLLALRFLILAASCLFLRRSSRARSSSSSDLALSVSVGLPMCFSASEFPLSEKMRAF